VLVEAAQRLLRTVDGLRDREVGRALLVDQFEGGIHESLDALLGTRARRVQAPRHGSLSPDRLSGVALSLGFGALRVHFHSFDGTSAPNTDRAFANDPSTCSPLLRERIDRGPMRISHPKLCESVGGIRLQL